MTEPRPTRRGRGRPAASAQTDGPLEDNPYRDDAERRAESTPSATAPAAAPTESADSSAAPVRRRVAKTPRAPRSEVASAESASAESASAGTASAESASADSASAAPAERPPRAARTPRRPRTDRAERAEHGEGAEPQPMSFGGDESDLAGLPTDRHRAREPIADRDPIEVPHESLRESPERESRERESRERESPDRASPERESFDRAPSADGTHQGGGTQQGGYQHQPNRDGRPDRGPRRGRNRQGGGGPFQQGGRPDQRPYDQRPAGQDVRGDSAHRPFDRKRPDNDRSNDRPDRQGGPGGGAGQQFERGGRNARRRNRQRNRQRDGQGAPHQQQGGQQGHQPQGQAQQQSLDRQPVVATADTTVSGWLGVGRDGAFIRQAANSYLPGPTDPFVPQPLMRQWGLRAGDKVEVTAGRDQRGRMCAVDVVLVNDAEPAAAVKRPEFGALTATYPDRKLTLETRRLKAGPEVTRRIIDLIAPIGYGQRALIVAPARAGKTMLLQAIMEGVAINHPEAALLVLLVDERPEEVSDMVAWGFGEVVASSFDMPADRHREVVEMVMERARRLVELGKDVVIVLDSITRMARAYNTIERGIGRTMSGGLDATAMAKPKAFFGSARAVAAAHGGGSLTIIATALVETGSRMDDVIFEEFKGTGNCEIKLDRSLAERRIYPAIDIPASGTRREDKLFRPDQLDAVYMLRRGLQQMPSPAAMEWLIKRIGVTASNDALLNGLKDA